MPIPILMPFKMKYELIAYISIFQIPQSFILANFYGYALYVYPGIRILFTEHAQRVNEILHLKDAIDMKLFQLRYVSINVP